MKTKRRERKASTSEPYIPASRKLFRKSPEGRHSEHHSVGYSRRRQRLSGLVRRHDRLGIDSRGRYFHGDLPPIQDIQHPGKQHRPDGGVRRRKYRRRCHLHDTRAVDSWNVDGIQLLGNDVDRHAWRLLGMLFTIPLRRAMIIENPLQFPEGVATAEVLKVGDSWRCGGEVHRDGRGDWRHFQAR